MSSKKPPHHVPTDAGAVPLRCAAKEGFLQFLSWLARNKAKGLTWVPLPALQQSCHASYLSCNSRAELQFWESPRAGFFRALARLRGNNATLPAWLTAESPTFPPCKGIYHYLPASETWHGGRRVSSGRPFTQEHCSTGSRKPETALSHSSCWLLKTLL